jgi:hypothetical protein
VIRRPVVDQDNLRNRHSLGKNALDDVLEEIEAVMDWNNYRNILVHQSASLAPFPVTGLVSAKT